MCTYIEDKLYIMGLNCELPPDLEAKALRQFDTLVSRGEILYEPPKTSIRWIQGFQVLIESLSAYMFGCKRAIAS